MKIKTKQIALLIGLLVIASAILSQMGRQLWCACGEPSLWKGEAWSSHTSQHLFDPYSFSHIQHGILFFLLFYFFKLPANKGFWLAGLCELGWEILENSSFIINRYRTATAALDYFGDSIINSNGDILSCLFGFMLAWKLPWKITLGLYLAMELGMLIFVHDSLSLNIIMLIYPLDFIRQWQIGMIQ